MSMDKYKINEYLDKLNAKEYKKAMKIIPKALKVSVNTFHNYRRLQRGASADIPHQKVLIFEALFKVSGGLENYEIDTPDIHELIRDFS